MSSRRPDQPLRLLFKASSESPWSCGQDLRTARAQARRWTRVRLGWLPMPLMPRRFREHHKCPDPAPVGGKSRPSRSQEEDALLIMLGDPAEEDDGLAEQFLEQRLIDSAQH